jgi:hypothetical protein
MAPCLTSGQRSPWRPDAGLGWWRPIIAIRPDPNDLHTEVPYPLRGGGLGERLVCGTLDRCARPRLKVVPRCWFVREVMGRHPEYRDLPAA